MVKSTDPFQQHRRMKMYGIRRIVCLASLAVLALPTIAAAKDDLGCTSVNFSDEVKTQFPRIVDTCQGVAMKGDEAYAKFTADVVSVDRQKNLVAANFIDRNGKATSKLTFAVKDDDRISVGGKSTKVLDLKKGDRVTLYIPHDRWGLYGTPDAAPLTIVSREDVH